VVARSGLVVGGRVERKFGADFFSSAPGALEGCRRFNFYESTGNVLTTPKCQLEKVGMRLSLDDLDFDYPEHLVATEPVRDSRLMFVPAARTSEPQEITKAQLLDMFRPGDLWVINNTLVLRRRLVTDQGLEVLFLRPRNAEATDWEVLCPASRWKPGQSQSVGDVSFSLVERGRPQTLRASQTLDEQFFAAHAELPLPPYIQKARGERRNRQSDASDYQTAWAKVPGSLAAPTASFHYDAEFLSQLKARGVRVAEVTLHVGLGTFLPITAPTLDQHIMHAEFVHVPGATREAIAETRRRNGRVVALGTTVARTLESAAQDGILSCVSGYENQAWPDLHGETRLMLVPGSAWREVDLLITNFHQPKSTLLALVASFAGDLEKVKRAYRWAMSREYRLFSYGHSSIWERGSSDR